MLITVLNNLSEIIMLNNSLILSLEEMTRNQSLSTTWGYDVGN